MIRILVFSDSHGTIKYMERMVKNLIDVDYIVHLGDLVKDARTLEDVFPEKKHFFVSGNCDFFDTEPSDKAFEIEGFKFFITHGHPYGVKTSLDRLISHAKENKVDCVLFGHTHIPICEKIDGMLILNPGSARQSFGIIEIEDGKINGCTMDVY